MGKIIACIPADSMGNKLFLKDLRLDGDRVFIQYRSTYNDIKFRETELFEADGGNNLVICGDDGTVLFRFSPKWVEPMDGGEV